MSILFGTGQKSFTRGRFGTGQKKITRGRFGTVPKNLPKNLQKMQSLKSEIYGKNKCKAVKRFEDEEEKKQNKIYSTSNNCNGIVDFWVLCIFYIPKNRNK